MWVIYHALVVGKELGNGYGHLVQGNGLDDDDDDIMMMIKMMMVMMMRHERQCCRYLNTYNYPNCV